MNQWFETSNLPSHPSSIPHLQAQPLRPTCKLINSCLESTNIGSMSHLVQFLLQLPGSIEQPVDLYVVVVRPVPEDVPSEAPSPGTIAFVVIIFVTVLVAVVVAAVLAAVVVTVFVTVFVALVTATISSTTDAKEKEQTDDNGRPHDGHWEWDWAHTDGPACLPASFMPAMTLGLCRQVQEEHCRRNALWQCDVGWSLGLILTLELHVQHLCLLTTLCESIHLLALNILPDAPTNLLETEHCFLLSLGKFWCFTKIYLEVSLNTCSGERQFQMKHIATILYSRYTIV